MPTEPVTARLVGRGTVRKPKDATCSPRPASRRNGVLQRTIAASDKRAYSDLRFNTSPTIEGNSCRQSVNAKPISFASRFDTVRSVENP